MDFTTEVEVAIVGERDVPKADYLRWIRDGDLATQARVYRLSESAWSRIKPEPTMSEHCDFMAGYLLECLLADPTPGDGFLHRGSEAGYEMAAWLKHLSRIPEAMAVVADVAARLAAAFKASDARTRNRIETAALEHALESPHVRPVFRAWSDDPVLRGAHEAALQWGLAHSDEPD